MYEYTGSAAEPFAQENDISFVTKKDPTPAHIPYGDVNGDHWVDVKDALEILKYAVGKIEKFPIDLQ